MADFPRLIGLTGRAGSGKDTLAQPFIEQKKYIALRLADPIKYAIEDMFELPADIWDGPQKEEELLDVPGQPSPRYLAQTLGSEWGRDLIHPDIWVYFLKRTVQANPEVNFIIPDVRFDNEARAIRELGGVVVEITRKDVDYLNHKSELGVSRKLVDGLVHNDYSQTAGQIMLQEAVRLATRL